MTQKLFTKGFSGDLEAAHAKGTVLAGEAIAQLRTVAAFNSESNIAEMFSTNLEIPLRRCFWKGQISGSVYGFCQFSLYAAMALGLWYASQLVRNGKSDFSTSIRVFMIIATSAYSAAETLTITPDLIKGDRAIRSVFKILDRNTQIQSDDPNAAPVSGRLRGEIEFRNVHFAYPTRPDVVVFRGLSFYARPGKTHALVGPSGCGKSSIISLIQRFYEPISGRIMIDGTDIRKFNLKSLRRHMALVPQEPCLFATSIYDNIAYGGLSSSERPPTEAEIIEAATLANAHKFISSLPQGYKTFAGERGVQLSGGQKQRIALARAFLKKPDIILLDEATSALDLETEMEVRLALDRVCEGKTTIVVAHRLATIRTAHSILVIENGKVAEQGSDAQLVKKIDGIYARMIHLQIPTTEEFSPN